jgi:REP element-mobilizing transposase RayT
MANSYTQIHIQAVFAVKYRDAVIAESWREELQQYCTGIIQNYSHKVLAIYAMPDHVHVLFGFRPTQSLADLMENLKGTSSQWINEKRFLKTKFAWQIGYGAFSYTKTDVPKVVKYVLNQPEHHKKRTFLEEYEDMLKRHEVEYDERYIFKELE